MSQCIECREEKDKEPIPFKCSECYTFMCNDCQKVLCHGWIKSYGFIGDEDDVKDAWNTNVCCTGCFAIKVITEPGWIVKHPNSYTGLSIKK